MESPSAVSFGGAPDFFGALPPRCTRGALGVAALFVCGGERGGCSTLLVTDGWAVQVRRGSSWWAEVGSALRRNVEESWATRGDENACSVIEEIKAGGDCIVSGEVSMCDTSKAQN